MTTQALSMPVDVTWQRLAYSTAMMDTDYAASSLPPKWRSSLCVFGHVVPPEQTADACPEARILYLRLTCSITGWNPSEELLDPTVLGEEADRVDDGQRSIWEAVHAAGWAGEYHPCYGAIAQVAISSLLPEGSGAAVFKIVPDAHFGSARHFVAGDRGLSEWIFTGTASDGTKVEVKGCEVFTVRGGTIAVKESFFKSRTL